MLEQDGPLEERLAPMVGGKLPDGVGEIDAVEAGPERPEQLGARGEGRILTRREPVETEVERVGRVVEHEHGTGPPAPEDVEAGVVGGP